MVRRSGKGGRGWKEGGGEPDASMGMRREDFEDEIDGFHKERDKVNLDVDDDLGDSEEEDEDEAVFNVKGAEDSSEEEEEDELDDEHLTGLAAKLAKQQKYLRQKVGGAKEDEDEDEEDEDEEEKDGPLWGKRKKAYYDADNVDYELQDSDEETPLEEEQEVMRLQKKLAAQLRPEDYEQEEEDEDEEEEEEDEATMQEALEEKEKTKGVPPGGKKEKGGKKKGKDRSDGEKLDKGGMAVEAVQKDLAALSKEEQMAAVMSDAPELVGLLADLRQSLDELRNKVQPLLEQVRAGEYATADGLSYLEAKHLLLLSYCSAIVFYLLLRAEGRSVRDHPVIARMVELRLYLEKIRPIDKKLQYQIDKLLKAANAQDTSAANGDVPGGMKKDEALQYRPNPDLLVSKLDADAQEGGGVYRPPMIAPTAMEDEDTKRDPRSKQRAERESRKRASRSAYVKELAAELEGRPEEVREALGMENREMQRERERLQKRAEEEENLFARVPLSRVERTRLRALQKNRNALSGLLDDFDDDVADIVNTEDTPHGSASATGAPPEDILKRRKLSQVIAEAGKPAKKAKVVSGDADLPLREELGERRRAHDTKMLNRKAKQIEFDDEEGSPGDGDGDDLGGGAEEDEFYREAKERRAAKLASKAAKFQREGAVPREEEMAEGKRTITREMDKNRGLTPHRKKLVRNPRKKYKVAHAKAVIRRKGQVREVQRETAPYGGQATGIKASVTRSTRLG